MTASAVKVTVTSVSPMMVALVLMLVVVTSLWLNLGFLGSDGVWPSRAKAGTSMVV
jgi:hypothetical protein